MAIERCQGSWYLLSILFYGGEVGYCVSFRDDARRRRLELLAMNRPATSGADRNAGQNCQRQFEVRFHRFILPGCWSEHATEPCNVVGNYVMSDLVPITPVL
jgi:hypothetical protein